MLLFCAGADAYPRGIFNKGEIVQYWLDDVWCTGNEPSLFNCRHREPTGKHNCGPRERAGVHCLGM